MFCSFVRTTRIRNPRLTFVFRVLWLGTLSVCIWSFFSGLQYTKMIGNRVVAEVEASYSEMPSTPDVTVGPLCKNSTKNDTISYQCPEVCNTSWAFHSSNITSCFYDIELIASASFDEVHLQMTIAELELGQQVLDRYGRPVVFRYRFTNIAALRMTIKYTTALTSPIPSFVAGLNNAIHPIDSQHTADTIVLDRNGQIWRRFEAGSKVTLTAAETLWLASTHGRDDDFIRDIQKRGDVPFQVTAENFFGAPDRFPLWAFFTGADVGGQIACFNSNYDVPSFAPNVETLGAGFSKPVCILHLRLYTVRFDSALSATKQIGLHSLFGAQALRLKVTGASGQYRAWDYIAILSHFVSMLVLLGLPSQVIRFIALNLLGHLSTLYERATIHTFDLKRQCGAVAVQLVQSASNFQQLADLQDYNGEGDVAISRDKLQQCLSRALQGFHCLDDLEMAELSTFCHRTIMAGPSSDAPIRRTEFQQACLLNQDIDLPSMAKLFDVNRRRYPGELLFMSSALHHTLHSCLQAQCTDPSVQKTEEIQNSAGMSCTNHEDGTCNASHQVDVLVRPCQESFDGKFQLIAETLHAVQGELDKTSSKLESMDSRITQVELSLRTEITKNPSISNSEGGTKACHSLHSNLDDHEPQLSHALQQIQGLECPMEDRSKEEDNCNVKSLESLVLSLEQKLVELASRQEVLIEEAVARASAAAVDEIRASLQLCDACAKTKLRAASFEQVFDCKLDGHDKQTFQKTRAGSANQDLDMEVDWSTVDGHMGTIPSDFAQGKDALLINASSKAFVHTWDDLRICEPRKSQFRRSRRALL